MASHPVAEGWFSASSISSSSRQAPPVPFPKVLSGQSLGSAETWRRKSAQKGVIPLVGGGGAGSWGQHFDALKLETLIPYGKPCCCAKEPPPGPHSQVGVREEEGRAEEARLLCVHQLSFILLYLLPHPSCPVFSSLIHPPFLFITFS